MTCILATGGAGYIGSHVGVALLDAGHELVIFDNFSNSRPEAVDRMEHIAGKSISVVRGDIRDQQQLETAIKTHDCRAVVHCACLKAVGESNFGA